MVLQFVQFKSFVDASFWHKLSELKLDVIRLDESEKAIHGYYSNLDQLNAFMEVDYTAFDR